MIDRVHLPATFQRLIEADQREYGAPEVIELTPPEAKSEHARQKRANWIAWRAASYPAPRHSEYLYRPDDDGEHGPKILISAVMSTPSSLDAYLEAFPRKRRYDVEGRKAISRGYTWRVIRPAEHREGIHEIIHSTTTRQGRSIAPQFADRPPEHDFSTYAPTGEPLFDDLCVGVFTPDGRLAAYLLGRRVGAHVQYDEIMGHGDHVASDVMYLLHRGFLETCINHSDPPRCLNYGSWYSGANPFSPEGGLNRWKRKVKFTPAYLVLASSWADSRAPAPR